jgi:hypothetical protein
MPHKILLNGAEYKIKKDSLPCLITYREKEGGSQLSISLIADLFLAGEKILFITAFPAGKDNFIEQAKDKEEKISYVTDAAGFNQKAAAIILESGNEKLLLDALDKLDDINERIVFIKNIETFSNKVFDRCLKIKNIILSGDLDKSSAKDQIAKNKFKTIIAFSKPAIPLPITLPTLKKFTGYLQSESEAGFIKVAM